MKPLRSGARHYFHIALALIALQLVTGCRKEKAYTWQQVIADVNCEPRKLHTKGQLGECPKVANLEHQSSIEVQEFVDYMNRKEFMENTVGTEGVQEPGCVRWLTDSTTGRPVFEKTGKKEGCSDPELLPHYKRPN